MNKMYMNMKNKVELSRVSQLDKYIIDIKLSIKEMNNLAKKLERAAASERIQCKRAIMKGNPDKARQLAENIVQNLNLSKNYLETSARLNGVIHYIQNAIQTKQLQKDVRNIMKCMCNAVKSREMSRVTLLMDRFERQFESLDMRSAVIGTSMAVSTVTVKPQLQTDHLLAQIAEEAGLDFKVNLPGFNLADSITSNIDEENMASCSTKLRK